MWLRGKLYRQLAGVVTLIMVSPPALACGSSRRVALCTLGCKVNTFETEVIAQKLAGDAWNRVGPGECADLYIINTCTVTAEADRQARQLARRAIRQNRDARVVVTGCYAQINPEACASIPGVDLVVGNSQKLDIPDLLDALYQGALPPVMIRDIDREISLPDGLLQGYEGRTRAFVQIQQGCDQGCTFCVIHTARGPNRSFPARMIRRQCERLIMNGYSELVLCGVDIGSYGTDFDDPDCSLTALLQTLVHLEGDYRIRLSSIDPAHITDELIELLGASESLCPQLHLSLQSANTLILKRMKRRATREMIHERVSRLRRAVPGLVLSADILVGFPTESEQQFGDTLTAIEKLEIAWPHVFAYSPRPGTPAARIPRQVPKAVRKERARRVREAGKRVWRQVALDQIGRRHRVLVESSGPAGIPDPERGGVNRVLGRAGNYYPVEFDAGNEAPATWANVKITGISEGKLTGERLVYCGG